MATGGSFRSSQIGTTSDMIYDFTCMSCLDDGKNTEAVFQCIECQTYYCQRCVDSHNKFVKNHMVLDEAAVKSGRGQTQQPVSASTNLPTDTCDGHDGEIIKMYCGSHDVVCCSICIAMDHRSCSGVEYIRKIARSLLQNQDRARAKTNLENVKADLQELKSKMLTFVQDTKKREDKTINDIRNSNELLQSRLEEIERSSVKDVKTKCKQIIDDVNSDVDHIDQMLKGVEVHLRRNRTGDNDNKTQCFINIKLMEMQSSEGKAYTNDIRRKQIETIDYKLNTSITKSLDDAKSFGALTVSKQWLTAVVGIIYITECTNLSSYTNRLHTELSENGITSDFIMLSDLDAYLCTVVLCEADNARNALLNIDKKLHSKIILVPIYKRRYFMDIPTQGAIKVKPTCKREWSNLLAGIEYISTDIDGNSFASKVSVTESAELKELQHKLHHFQHTLVQLSTTKIVYCARREQNQKIESLDPDQETKTCVICNKYGPKLIRVKHDSRNQLYIQTGVFKPKYPCCCPKHCFENRLTTDALKMFEQNGLTKSESTITGSELIELLEFVRINAKESQQKRLCFDDFSVLSDDDYLNLTGLSKSDFKTLSSYV